MALASNCMGQSFRYESGNGLNARSMQPQSKLNATAALWQSMAGIHRFRRKSVDIVRAAPTNRAQRDRRFCRPGI
jgi:ribosomal protein L20A (L18A)